MRPTVVRSSLVVAAFFVATVPATADEPPAPLRRADAFLGIHFDFHAGTDCTEVGARTTPEMVRTVIDKVHPDYIQIDCKGHPGYSSYPTEVGNPAPGFVGDPLKVWRKATRAQGVPLFMHYSGVIDQRAVQLHPDWAARKADGSLHARNRSTSVFSPYVDELMIPQLRELAGKYQVDGVWVDGDCWGLQLDYSDAAVKAYRQATGERTVPKNADDPRWHAWRDFHREGYRRYVRRYVDALKSSHPDFQVISNWSFSGHMPEPVCADVAGLSGDFRSQNSVNSARFQGRCLEDQGVPWDLMAWSFDRDTRHQKPASQLKQEAAVVLALGGGFQAYFKQDRDGAVRDLAEMDVMAEVAQFCRARQAYCHKSTAVPQIALFYSRYGHYRTSPALFNPNSSHVRVLEATLQELLDDHQAVQILSEHQLDGQMERWPLIVIPSWPEIEPAFRDRLARHAKRGGSLLLVGPGPAALFQGELDQKAERIVAVPEPGDGLTEAVHRLLPEPLVEVTGASHVDVSPRILDGRLTIHMVNTSGPHAAAPPEGIDHIEPIGPVTVALRLPKQPTAVVRQPQGESLDVSCKDGRAVVTLPELAIYDILVIEP